MELAGEDRDVAQVRFVGVAKEVDGAAETSRYLPGRVAHSEYRTAILPALAGEGSASLAAVYSSPSK